MLTTTGRAMRPCVFGIFRHGQQSSHFIARGSKRTFPPNLEPNVIIVIIVVVSRASRTHSRSQSSDNCILPRSLGKVTRRQQSKSDRYREGKVPLICCCCCCSVLRCLSRQISESFGFGGRAQYVHVRNGNMELASHDARAGGGCVAK